jgi:hypothetical protein
MKLKKEPHKGAPFLIIFFYYFYLKIKGYKKFSNEIKIGAP